MRPENRKAGQSTSGENQQGGLWKTLVGMACGIAAAHHARQKQTQENEASIVFWTKVIGIGTCAAAIVAAGAAILLILQLRDGRETTILANRAWMAPTGAGPLQIKPSKQIVYGVSTPNLGRAPATGLHWRFDAYPIAAPPGHDYRATKFRTDNMCADLRPDPGAGDAGYPLPGTLAMTKTEITPKSLLWTGDIENGKQVVVVRGCVAYETVGTVGHSAFCFIFDSMKVGEDGKITYLPTACQTGNTAN